MFIFYDASFPSVFSVGWDGGLPCAGEPYIYSFPLWEFFGGISGVAAWHFCFYGSYDDILCWLAVSAHISCHIYNKTSEIKCSRCGKRTAAKDQICCACDNTKAQMLERYHNVYKYYLKEAYRLRQIFIN